MIEREIKLPFDDVAGARQLVLAAGGRPAVPRRLIDDRLFDTPDQRLRREGRALRVRRDGSRTTLTAKGPAPSTIVKAREELETTVGGADTIEAILVALGYRQSFHAQKYREEFTLPGSVCAAVDETPIGVFVELEGDEDAIIAAAAALGRAPAAFVLESYPALYHAWCAARGLRAGEMLFAAETS
jgi:adenylate cyclase class 2